MAGLIEDYVSYASRLTDAPIEYHRALALNLESACIGRTPILINPNPMFTHGFTLLTGRSTLDRKTTSLEILNSVLPTALAKIPNEYSREALLAALSDNPQAIGLFDECGGLLKQLRNPKHYNSGLDDTLCSIYSCPDIYVRKLRSETFTINEPYLNLAWATTLRKFKGSISVDGYTSGFLPRFQVVYAEKTSSLPRRNLDSEDTRLLGELKAKAQGIYDFFRKNQCSFKFESTAFKLISEWQAGKEVIEYDNEDMNDSYATIASRSGDYVIKHSALFEVDRLSDSVSNLSVSKLVTVSTSPIMISEESVRKSMDYNDKILTVITTKLLNLLTETGVSKELVKLTNCVRRCAQADGWAERRDVLPRMNLKATQFEEILQTAIQSGKIECETRERKQLLRVIIGGD